MIFAENTYTWWFDSTSIVLRYFILAGLGYFIFYKWKRNYFLKFKIQQSFPATTQISRELIYSISTLIIYCLVSWMVFMWYGAGITKVYINMDQYGFWYFVFSIVLMVIIHDTYFYWTHRLIHLPYLFKWIHKTHHLSHNPTPWSAFAFHPIEAIISVGIIPIIVFVIPAHPYALFVFLSYMTLINVMGHLGYELFSKKFRNNVIGSWQNTATYHNLHHQFSKKNYGLYFTFWDRLMKTYNQGEEEE